VFPRPSCLTLAALLLAVPPASAHELIVQYRILPGQKIEVESFFELGDPPRKALVSVFRSDNSLLHEGDLDDKGFHVFSYSKVEDLRIEVRDKTLHKAVVRVPAAELAAEPRRLACSLAACLTPPTTSWTAAVLFAHPPEEPSRKKIDDKASPTNPGNEEPPRLERHGSSTLADVLAGAALLLALASFYLGVKNARTLREMKKTMENR